MTYEFVIKLTSCLIKKNFFRNVFNVLLNKINDHFVFNFNTNGRDEFLL